MTAIIFAVIETKFEFCILRRFCCLDDMIYVLPFKIENRAIFRNVSNVLRSTTHRLKAVGLRLWQTKEFNL